jgi:hypothetical protein
MDMSVFSALKEELRLKKVKFKQLEIELYKKEGLSKVFATGAYYSFFPFRDLIYIQEGQISKGKILKGIPSSLKDKTQFVLNDKQELQAKYTFGKSEQLIQANILIRISESEQRLYVFQEGKKLIAISLLTFQNDLLNEVYTQNDQKDQTYQRYTYNSNGIAQTLEIVISMPFLKSPRRSLYSIKSIDRIDKIE